MDFPFKAVLFDMDGTITDTTPLHDAAWDDFARAHTGQGLNPGDPRLVPGRTIDVVLYWQHWTREPLAAQRLTEAVKQAARAQLLQT